jgi:hypothetical protein
MSWTKQAGVLLIVLASGAANSEAAVPTDLRSAGAVLAGCRLWLGGNLDGLQQGNCIGQITALLSVASDLGETFLCRPPHLSQQEEMQSVVAYIEKQPPQRLSDDFWNLASEAIAASFPCLEPYP